MNRINSRFESLSYSQNLLSYSSIAFMSCNNNSRCVSMDDAAANAIHSNKKHENNRITKLMGAFSTPRIKKCSMKAEPFRSIQSLAKASNTATSVNATRSRTTVVKSMAFQTPRKVMEKSPSTDITPLTKVCADLKKLEISGEINHVPSHFCGSSRCAANDPNYSSPASVPTKKYLSAQSLQPNQATKTIPLRCHTKPKGDTPSSSETKDSRSLLRHPPSSHRRALFSEQDMSTTSQFDRAHMPVVLHIPGGRFCIRSTYDLEKDSISRQRALDMKLIWVSIAYRRAPERRPPTK